MNQPAEAQTPSQPSQTKPATCQQPSVSLADVTALAKAEVADDIIINQIINTRSTYILTAQAIIDLKNAGVSEKIIAYMMNPKPNA